MMFTVDQIAHVTHEANRAVQEILATPGIPVAEPWGEFDEAQRAGVVDGVRGVLTGNTPEESHANWCALKVAEGWTYGEAKDPILKTHPCLVDYADLPPSQQFKDHLFVAIVRALSDMPESP